VGREINWDKNLDLYDCLAEVVGIRGRLEHELDDPRAAIREIAGSAAVLFLDGLDEIPAERRGEVERDLINFGRLFPSSKIIVSCRSGDYDRFLDGFETAEIEPLSTEQIRELVTDWLGEVEGERFIRVALNPDHPSHELANRPLFLTQMVTLHVRRGNVPERPVDLCRSVVRLVIEDWDDQRGVHRTSKYANFGRDEKFSFLADLAYELMAHGLYRFSTYDLETYYKILAPRYDLPANQAGRVTREIESHTGLVVESGGRFEFSHLSIQEFLTGDSMIRRKSFYQSLSWTRLPALGAIMVALSPDGTEAIRDFVSSLPNSIDDISPLKAFLARLGQERPRFTPSFGLAENLLWLVFKAQISDAADVESLFRMRSVRRSIEIFHERKRYEIHSQDGRSRLAPVAEYRMGRTFSVPTALLEAF
jgi:hypothetical protein